MSSKIKITAVILAVLSMAACFSGCHIMDSGSYHMTREHSGPESVPLSGQWVITNIDTLRMAVTELIHEHVESDVLTISGYSGDLEEDLRMVSAEVSSEDPMGVYAVTSIIFEQSKVLSYHQVGVSISYRYSKEEMDAVATASSRDHLDRMLDEMFLGFEDGITVMLPEGVIEEEDNIYGIIMERWRQHPSHAIELGEIKCTGYPDITGNCILDISVDYLSNKDTLEAVSDQIEQMCVSICSGYRGTNDTERFEYILRWLENNVEMDREALRVIEETGGNHPKTAIYTAKGALLEREASEEGITLAAAALCECFGYECYVAYGTKNGKVHSWIEIDMPDHVLIFDPTSADPGSRPGETVNFYIEQQPKIFIR